jgi:HNH endonuclease
MPTGIYQRKWKQQDADEDFWSNVQLEDTIFPENGCMIWTGPGERYGAFSRDGKQHRAHRWIYERLRGPIPKGMQIDHLCRVPLCVNPDHLELVTAKENQRRSPLTPGNQTHCARGHEFAGENLRFERNGQKRVCHICSIEKKRRYRERMRKK